MNIEREDIEDLSPTDPEEDNNPSPAKDENATCDDVDYREVLTRGYVL